jgi:ribulose-bisphosphate carboxylase large chain
MHYLVPDTILQFGGGTIGHPDRIQVGSNANRVAAKSTYHDHNDGRAFWKKSIGDGILNSLA